MSQQAEAMWFYVGGTGISIYRLDLSTGDLVEMSTVSDVKNPSFQAIHPTNRFLYSVAEVEEGGALHAFAIDAATGALRSLNHQSCMGAGPCHVSVDATGHVALVANYSSGGVAALPIREDGSLGEATSVFPARRFQRASGPAAGAACAFNHDRSGKSIRRVSGSRNRQGNGLSAGSGERDDNAERTTVGRRSGGRRAQALRVSSEPEIRIPDQ